LKLFMDLKSQIKLYDKTDLTLGGVAEELS
jgi:hypothetical protein